MSIISPVNISDTIPLNTCLPYNPAPSHQPGSYSSMFSDHWFERDLFENKMSESNILKASETLVIENHHRCGSVHDGVGEVYEEKSEKQMKRASKGKSKSKSKTYVAKKVPTRNKDNHAVNKQTIISNLCLHIIFGGRVFDLDIIHKPGTDSVYDLVEIQSWSHLFKIKSHVLHEEESGMLPEVIGRVLSKFSL
uniref:Uncharacterized protein n=1 Tax=Solanum lycopersicum TaxID=4081 RepID=A0A3Q7EBQ8_SOLLC